MKVLDTRSGMIISPCENKYTKKAGYFDISVEKVKNIFSEAVLDINVARISWGDPDTLSPARKLGIYIGKEKSDYWIDNCRKHHIVLVDGLVCKLSGYEFRYIQPG